MGSVSNFKTMISDSNGEQSSHINHTTRLPSLQALRCFEMAARLQNFTRAAEALHLTHGAISRAVRLLEEDLGLALFERKSRRVHLTEAGQQLAQAVHEGLARMQQASDALREQARRQQQALQQRPLVLSCEPTLLMRWLIPRWPDFQARHPGANVHLLAGGGPLSFDNGIDLAIRRNDFDRPAHWHATPLFTEKIGPVCRPDKLQDWFEPSPSPASSPISSLTAALQLRHTAPRLHTRTRPKAWSDWERARSIAIGQASTDAAQQTFEHFYFSLQAAVAGLGVAMAPLALVRDDIASGVLAAPLGFVEDGSAYQLLAPQAIEANSPSEQLLQWLQQISAPEMP